MFSLGCIDGQDCDGAVFESCLQLGSGAAVDSEGFVKEAAGDRGFAI
jgi:hypothetical protein